MLTSAKSGGHVATPTKVSRIKDKEHGGEKKSADRVKLTCVRVAYRAAVKGDPGERDVPTSWRGIPLVFEGACVH